MRQRLFFRCLSFGGQAAAPIPCSSNRNSSRRRTAAVLFFVWNCSGGLLAVVRLPGVDADGAGGVADDVQRGTAHVEQAVDAVDDADVRGRDADCIQHHGQHDHAGAGGTGGTDGGQRRRHNDDDHLHERQIDADALGEEDRGHTLIDGCAVHVDRCAQRQYEGGDLMVHIHIVAALLRNGQRGHRGGGGEGEGGSGEHLLEEGDGGQLGKDLHRQAVHQHHVDDVADVGGQEHQAQGAEDLRALRGHHPHHQREDTVGGEGQDEAHDLLRDLIEGGDEAAEGLALLAGHQDAAAEEQRDHDDLQHGGIGQRRHGVARENTDQRIHRVGALGLIGGVLRQLQHREGALENIGDREPDHAGNGGGDQEVSHGLPADLADLLDVELSAVVDVVLLGLSFDVVGVSSTPL